MESSYHLNNPEPEQVSQADPSLEPGYPHSEAASPIGRIHPELAEGEVEVLKVSAKSRPSSVAGAIAGVMRQADRV